jgi:hypothetical protein
MDIDEDNQLSFSVRVKLTVTVWDFILPITPSLPAVFGVSFFLSVPCNWCFELLILNIELAG